MTGTVRHYAEAATLNQEGVDARVWAGIHFRTADTEGDGSARRLGRGWGHV